MFNKSGYIQEEAIHKLSIDGKEQFVIMNWYKDTYLSGAEVQSSFSFTSDWDIQLEELRKRFEKLETIKTIDILSYVKDDLKAKLSLTNAKLLNFNCNSSMGAFPTVSVSLSYDKENYEVIEK